MSKGSKQRPTDLKKYSSNYDKIFGKKNPVKKNMDKLHKPKTHRDKQGRKQLDKNHGKIQYTWEKLGKVPKLQGERPPLRGIGGSRRRQ